MLARRLATILPATRPADAREPTCIHSVAGLIVGRTAVVTTRPFRALHHTISAVGLIGGGPRTMPGEVSLAHHGLLLEDEQCPQGHTRLALPNTATPGVPRIGVLRLLARLARHA